MGHFSAVEGIRLKKHYVFFLRHLLVRIQSLGLWVREDPGEVHYVAVLGRSEGFEVGSFRLKPIAS